MYLLIKSKFKKRPIAKLKPKPKAKNKFKTHKPNYLNQRLTRLGFSSYTEYLNGRHWSEFKLRYFLVGGRKKCSICNSKDNLNLHHKDYRNLGRETSNDVCCLCRNCHSAVHRQIRANPKLPFRLAVAIFRQNFSKSTPKCRIRL